MLSPPPPSHPARGRFAGWPSAPIGPRRARNVGACCASRNPVGMLHLTTLGALSLESDLGSAVGAALRRRPLALLALASASPHGLTRDKALAHLWPESDSAHARNCLKQTLFALRRDVGQELFLPGAYSLRIDGSAVEVDRWLFERAVESGRLREAADLPLSSDPRNAEGGSREEGRRHRGGAMVASSRRA